MSSIGIVLVDLDGTLANCQHRLHHIHTKGTPNWDAFYGADIMDSPNIWCVEIIKSMRVGHTVEIVTARRMDRRGATEHWLLTYLGFVPKIHWLRKLGDHSLDVDLKRNWLKSYEWKDDILFVIEDRQRVVNMWRQEGLVCLQCDVWEEYRGTDE